MDLALLTKPTMARAIRHQLPLLNESRIRQAFNLKRALLEAQIPMNGAEADHLAIAVTHLSAFSHGDGTMTKQIAALENWMEQQPPNQPWILAGDLNLLPPDDDPARLGEDAALYADGANPISSLVARFQTALQPLTDPANRTYIPFGATQPDRKIDYLFFGGPLILEDSRVLRDEALRADLSDHLPIWARFHIQTPKG
jgi:endonuclease/exonuclease/phosphatase family metal-dependent hydrolase